MMACVVESYQPLLQPCPFPLEGESAVFLQTAWLKADCDELQIPEFTTPVDLSCRKARTSRIAPEARAPAWWESELASSIHETLKKKENNLTKIEMKSPQLTFRAEIVDYISVVCRNLDISIGTRYTAVRLLDYFMDGHNIMYYRLKLVALVCLLIAAKFEERDDCIPTIEALHHSSRLVDTAAVFTSQELATLELYALKYFKWNISRPSIAHFIDYYNHESLNKCKCQETMKTMIIDSQVHELTMRFMEAALREQQFLCHNPSKIAAAIVCVVRICTCLERVWSPDLQQISQYTLEDLQPIVARLLMFYEEWKI